MVTIAPRARAALLGLSIGCAVALPAAGADEAQPASYARTAGNSLFHLAGYAFAGYASADGNDSFDTVGFNPIVHFTYRDRLLFEGELEITSGPDGETEVELEYGSIDVFLGENAILIVGKFLSPLGNYFQNLHPAWVNKLPAEPLGFGHDGAAPLTENGVQLRGGFALESDARLGYALYIGNGPELEGEMGEIEAVMGEGFARDLDGQKVVGGRVSWWPRSDLEVAASYATGEAAVTTMDGLEVAGDPARDYEARGIDVWWRPRSHIELRGEYIAQEVGDSATSVAPNGGTWDAWYAQGACRLGSSPWELVLRYGDFATPHNPAGQQQWTGGVVYYIAPHAPLKLAYERNSGDAAPGVSSLENRVLLQLAYGF